MHLRDLFEGPEQDITASHVGDKVRIRLYAYLYRKCERATKYGQDHLGLDKDAAAKRAHEVTTLDTIVYGGVEYPSILLRSAIPDIEIAKDIVVCFRESDFAMTGSANHLKIPVHGLKHFIFIDSLGNGILDCMRAINSDRGANIFRHEFQHVLDAKRYKGDMFRRGSRNSYNGPRGDREPTAKEQRDYHNETSELNAFYHNLAEPLLARLRFYQEHEASEPGATALIYNPDISLDFREYLDQRTSKLHGTLARHWQHLTQKNRKRAIQRLAQLHAIYVRAWNASMAAADTVD